MFRCRLVSAILYKSHQGREVGHPVMFTSPRAVRCPLPFGVEVRESSDVYVLWCRSGFGAANPLIVATSLVS